MSDKALTIEEIHKLPKTDLHCHLDGSVRVPTLMELAEKRQIELPAKDEKSLRKNLEAGKQVNSLADYLRAFDTTLSVMQDEEDISQIAEELCEDAWNEGVWYLEVRFSPILHQRKSLRLTQVMNAVLHGLKAGEQVVSGNSYRLKAEWFNRSGE